ncbi:MAG: PQQ-dependent dehydrogenase, methanol/ethanol family [Acidimicrobiia bacterium]|nr:PQQ-dependent dehydrogenase, methanol/ethanol family [Acidimicrobiia bacterium]
MRALLFLLSLTMLVPAQVTYERILHAYKEPGSWLTYSGNYLGHRYSQLDQIHRGNVSRLRVAWVHQSRATEAFQTSPIVADGVMYITEPPNIVKALDLKTGRALWTYQRTIPDDLRLCCGRVNRGVAVLDDKVFYNSIDGHMMALDAATGRLLWDVEMADYKLGYSATQAPLAIEGKVITGIAGGEFGIRAFIDAYEPSTGKRLWRFYTVPTAGEFGVDTWAGDSYKTGAASIWVTGSYDPESNTLFWGTGNPGPDWNGDGRKGDNLFSDCVVALDADTGQRKWHFQFTPHDVHDWDSTQVPVLIDAPFRGAARKMLITANRNGFYYVLDRGHGKFLQGKPYVKQTWASGLDDNGRPMVLPNTTPTEEGNTVWPSLGGGTNWYSPSYSPQARLFYVPAREEGAIYYKGEAEYKPGAFFNGGGQRLIPGEESYGAIRALDPETGDRKWEFRLRRTPTSGLLTTAGGLLFSGTSQGEFLALDAATGKLLWSIRLGGAVSAAPISYMHEGKQYISIAAGTGLFQFALE